MILVDKFNEISDESCQQHLRKTNSIIIPHGTMIAYMSREEIEKITIPFFGNKWIIKWEADRKLKQQLMNEALLTTPRYVESKDDIERLCIVKLHGAAGGRGYFLAWNRQSFEEAAKKLMDQGVITSEDDLYIQEYVNGVPTYLQFFYSSVTNVLEFMGVDRRYESDVDGMGRIPAKQQLGIEMQPSYNVIGNIPLVLRESLLEEVYAMGERFVKTARRLVPPGMTGPFCIEGIYDREVFSKDRRRNESIS
jgi:5-formaminoimidazole-4-carboxamide-1-(beta)-D-ribofuranosyl 5'-monophosphate synthetase